MKLAFVCGALGLAACASVEKVQPAVMSAPEVVIEAVPAGATLYSGETELGRTPLVFAIQDRKATYRLRAVREGYHPQEFALVGEEAAANAGSKVLVPLRPASWDKAARPIGVEDAGQLTHAGIDLMRQNKCPEALQFFQLSVAADPRVAGAHKGMGICYAKLKQTQKALEAYKNYLVYFPDAPDAEKVQAIISRAQGDFEVPGN